MINILTNKLYLKYFIFIIITIIIIISYLFYIFRSSENIVKQVLENKKSLIVIDGFYTLDKKIYYKNFFESRISSIDNFSIWSKVPENLNFDKNLVENIKIISNVDDKSNITIMLLNPGKYTLSEISVNYLSKPIVNKNLESYFFFDVFPGEVVYLGKITTNVGKNLLINEILTIEDDFPRVQNFIHRNYPPLLERLINRKIYF